ncbi:hypothetical protein BK022_26850 [Methylorubrum extorquens]|uniref:Uncharacterized protein n=1 Tax=Methylorubrum extorquens TaxID=408 RepID=A0A1S1NSG1_METEX|nr:hypothetical protein BK022_26850 [Methylorubrum extorquens]
MAYGGHDQLSASPPYSITIEPLKKPDGQFGWALRKHGKPTERSDRSLPTEAKAFENALRAVEKDQAGFGSR